MATSRSSGSINESHSTSSPHLNGSAVAISYLGGTVNFYGQLDQHDHVYWRPGQSPLTTRQSSEFVYPHGENQEHSFAMIYSTANAAHMHGPPVPCDFLPDPACPNDYFPTAHSLENYTPVIQDFTWNSWLMGSPTTITKYVMPHGPA